MPLSDEVASMVPVELIERNEIGALCAWMTFATVLVTVLKMSTSPVCDVDAGTLEEVLAVGRAPEGTVDGYARYEFSDEGESAQMAKPLVKHANFAKSCTYLLGLEPSQ